MKRTLSHACETKSRKNLLFLCVFITLICVTVLTACGNTPVSSAQTHAPAVNETQTPKLSNPPKLPSTLKPVESEAPTEYSTETIASILEGIINNNENCEITYTDDSITVNIWGDDFGFVVSSIRLTGGDENNSDWVTIKDSTIELAGSICNLIDTLDRTDVLLYFNVLNDEDTGDALLMLQNTTIVYDCLA